MSRSVSCHRRPAADTLRGWHRPDRTGGGTVWVSSNPPIYATGLTTPYGPGGTFDVQLKVEAALNDDHRLPRRGVRRRDPQRPHPDRRPVTGRVRAGDLHAVRRPARAPSARRRCRGPAGVAPRSVPAASGTATDPAAGCGPSTAVVDTNAIDPITPATDAGAAGHGPSADGRDVTVTDVSRILPVNLYGSIAEIVFSLGLGGNVVGRDIATTFDAAKDLPLVTTAGIDLSAEAILELEPQRRPGRRQHRTAGGAAAAA